MSKSFRTRLVKFGNERAIRLPKWVIEQLGLKDTVVLEIQAGRLIIRASHPREGWEEAAKAMHAAGDDRLLDEYMPTRFDLEEWEW